jgi:hypothetical protein
VNGVNIMIDNGLTSYFASWLDKEVDIGPQNVATPTTLAYNNVIEINEISAGGTLSASGDINNTLILKTFHTHLYIIYKHLFYITGILMTQDKQ